MVSKLTVLFFILAAVLMTACDVEGQYGYGSPASTVDPVAAATQNAYYAANSNATAQAHIARQTSVSADETRRVQEWANGTAAAAQAEAQATQVVVMATEYAFSSMGTTQALAGLGTANAAVFNATGTIAAAQAAAVATSEFARAEAQIRIVAEEAERLELANREKEASITRSYIWLVGLLLIVLVGVSSFAYLKIRAVSQASTPVVVGNGPERTILVYDRLTGWMNASPPMIAAPAERPMIAMPSSRTDVVALPPMAKGHVLIAGETGSGKSTAVRAALQRRQNVVVLDPHYKPGSWGNVKVIGAGRDFESIGIFMEKMRGLLSDRYNQRANGRKEFSPLTVATDEMPAIVSALGREVGDAWREWLREGRKVGLFFIVSTQSTRVRTLGIEGEGDLLENFAYVLMLGKVAAGKYPDLVAGQERPAVIQTRAGVRPVTVPLIEPSGGGEVVRLARGDNNQNGASNGYVSPSTDESLMAQYRDQIEAVYWQYVQENGKEPSMRFLEESTIGYVGGQAHKVVTSVLEQMRPRRDAVML